MSTLEQIQTEIDILSTAKADISAALVEKNVPVPNLFIDYGNAIRAIEVGVDEYLSSYVDKSIDKIGLSVGLSSIREKAFYNCNNLTSITILSSVKEMGQDAFAGCNRLIEITFANNWTGSSNYLGLPYDCNIQSTGPITQFSAETDYHISSNVHYSYDNFGNRWVWYTKNREGDPINLYRTITNGKVYSDTRDPYATIVPGKAIVPDIIEGRKVEYLGNYYFFPNEYSISMTRALSGGEVSISQHIYKFGEYTFNNTPITGLKFLLTEPADSAEERVVTFGQSFANTLGWTLDSFANETFEFPVGKVSTIPSYMFMQEKSFSKINIPNTVTFIGNGAFSGAEGLKEIHIPDSVISCYRSIFNSYCNRLSSVYIGKNVRYIDNIYRPPFFSGLSALEDITYACKLSSFHAYSSGGESYKLLGGLSSLKTLNLYDSYSNLANLSYSANATTMNLPGNAIFNFYDAAERYSDVKTRTVNILSVFPNSIV